MRNRTNLVRNMRYDEDAGGYLWAVFPRGIRMTAFGNSFGCTVSGLSATMSAPAKASSAWAATAKDQVVLASITRTAWYFTAKVLAS